MGPSSRYLIGGTVVGYTFDYRLVCSILVCHIGEIVVESIQYFRRCHEILPAGVFMFFQCRVSHILVKI